MLAPNLALVKAECEKELPFLIRDMHTKATKSDKLAHWTRFQVCSVLLGTFQIGGWIENHKARHLRDSGPVAILYFLIAHTQLQ